MGCLMFTIYQLVIRISLAHPQQLTPHSPPSLLTSTALNAAARISPARRLSGARLEDYASENVRIYIKQNVKILAVSSLACIYIYHNAKNPLRDEPACQHLALRALRAGAAQVRIYVRQNARKKTCQAELERIYAFFVRR